MSKKPLQVCLIFHSTRSDNLGVGALTVSEVEIIRDISKQIDYPIDITVMDWKDPRTSYVTGPDIYVRDLDGRVMVDPRGYFATARRSDLVIDIGGGDSFADIYGNRRLNRMFLLKYLTHIAGTPLIMAPQTIGPFKRTSSRIAARASLHLCSIVATRDNMSTKAAHDLGVKNVIEASDVALRLPYDPPTTRSPNTPVRVGINVSGLLMGGGYTGFNEFGLKLDYPALISDLIHHFENHSDGCEVHLVPHVIVPEGRMTGEDDYRVCAALAEKFPKTVLAPSFSSPSEAKSYIANLDFFMGARMHACIAAFSSNVPVVPMAYSRKFAGLFGSLGYNHTVDCTTETGDRIKSTVFSAYENREILRRDAAVALAEGLKRLSSYEHSLRKVLISQRDKKR